MPSNKKPLSTVQSSAGKLHADIATASSQLFPEGAGQEALLTFLNNAAQRELIEIHTSGPLVATGQTSFELHTITFDDIWLGDAGSGLTHPDGATPIQDLFQVTDANGNVLKEIDKDPVEIVSVSGVSIGDGFVPYPTAVTVNFNVALPTSGTFRIYWGARAQVASITKDIASFTNMRQQRNVEPLALIARLEELHAEPGREQAWNDPWDATIEGLAASGLNERYRRSTGLPPLTAAVARLFFSVGIPSNGDTVTIGSKTYTYLTVLSFNVDGNVLIGASRTEAIQNLSDAINLTGVPGVQYAAATTINPDVSATPSAASMGVTAKTPLPDEGGNNITLSESGALLAWDTGTLHNGQGFTNDDPGNGSRIIRDGPAPTIEVPEGVSVGYNNVIDPFNASWMSLFGGTDSTQIWPGVGNDGPMGFTSLGSVRFTSSVGERTHNGMSVGGFYHGVLRNIGISSIGGASVRSPNVVLYDSENEPTSNTCILNPDAGVTEDDRRTIELTSFGATAYNGAGNSEIALGYDLLRLRYRASLNNRPDEVYVITDCTATNRVRVRTLSGAPANFPSGSSVTDVTAQIIKTTFHQGGGAGWAHGTFLGHADPVQLDTSLYHAVLPSITDDPATAPENYIPNPARFLAAARTAQEYSHTGAAIPLALQWGGFDPTDTAGALTPNFPGHLRGDGGVDATIYSTKFTSDAISAAGTFTWHPGIDGAAKLFTFSHASGTIAWTLALDAAYDPIPGEKLEIILNTPVNAPPGGTALVDVTWPGGFVWDDGEPDGLFRNQILWVEAIYNGFSWTVTAKNFFNQRLKARTLTYEPHTISLSGGGAFTWRPMTEGGYVQIDVTDGNAYTMTLTGEGAAFPISGDTLYIEVINTPGTGGTIAWPSDFTFSGADGVIPAGAGDRILYRLIRSPGVGSADWLITRTDY